MGLKSLLDRVTTNHQGGFVQGDAQLAFAGVVKSVVGMCAAEHAFADVVLETESEHTARQSC